MTGCSFTNFSLSAVRRDIWPGPGMLHHPKTILSTTPSVQQPSFLVVREGGWEDGRVHGGCL